MKKQEKGFTLLEVIATMFLFVIFLEGLWGFFSNMYISYAQFDKKTVLSEQAQNVNDFVREQIRTAEQITFEIQPTLAPSPSPSASPGVTSMPTPVPTTAVSPVPTFISEFVPIEEKANNVTVEGMFKEMRFKSSTGNSGKITLEPTNLTTNPGKGTYSLYYTADTSGASPILIADMVANIKVSRELDSEYVTFVCEFYKDGEKKEQMRLTTTFTESLAFKKKL